MGLKGGIPLNCPKKIRWKFPFWNGKIPINWAKIANFSPIEASRLGLYKCWIILVFQTARFSVQQIDFSKKTFLYLPINLSSWYIRPPSCHIRIKVTSEKAHGQKKFSGKGHLWSYRGHRRNFLWKLGHFSQENRISLPDSLKISDFSIPENTYPSCALAMRLRPKGWI